MTTIADIAETQRLALTSLSQRMADFEAHLKASPPGANLSDLYKDFTSFKDHVWSVFSVLQQQLMEVSKGIDSIEMRHRKKFLLLGGVPEKPDEQLTDTVLSIMQCNLGLVHLQSSSLTVCHRLGTASEGRPRPILFRFSDPAVKTEIWKSKTKLKGSSFVLSEFLTRQRQVAFTTARKLFGVTNVWTLDGTIHIKLPDGNRRRVFSHEEVMVLGREHGKSLQTEAPSAPKATAKIPSPSPVVQVSVRPKRNVQKK